MSDPFADLIPQQPDDPFGDLIPAATVDPRAAPEAAPERFGAGGIAVFGDENAPFQGIKPELAAAYNELAKTGTADDLFDFATQNGLAGAAHEAPRFRSIIDDYVAKRDAGKLKVGDGVAYLDPTAPPAPELSPGNQAAAADIASSDGTMDWIGDLLSRGAYGVEAGGKRFGAAIHDLNDIQLPWWMGGGSEEDHLVSVGESRLAQMDLRDEAAQLAALAGTAVPGEVGGDQAFAALGSADFGTLGQFVLEQGVQSVPGMATILANPIAYVMSNTGNIAQSRAANNGREDATGGDVAAALPFGIASSAAERAGIERMFGATGRNAAIRVGKASVGEGATEVVQTGLEGSGGAAGTDAGVNLPELFKGMVLSGIAGAGMGGAVRGAVEAPGAVVSGVRAANEAQQGVRMLADTIALPAPDMPLPSARMEPGTEPMIAPRFVEGSQVAPEPQADPFADLVPPESAAPVAPGQPVDPQPAAPQGGGVEPGGLGTSEPQRPMPVAAALPITEPQPLQDGERHVRTPAGNKVRTRMEVVDASTLAKAEGAMQNRDRSRDTTTLQVQDIIGKFDPELLGDDPSSDRGAPIVGGDNVVYSGNGRMLALNKIFEQYPEKAQAYRRFIEAQGFSTEGVERPVLVRRITQDMTPEELRQFVVESNKDNKLEMSPVERARSDADTVTPEMLERYAGGDLNSTANRSFVEAFTKNLTAGEMGNVIGSDRRLTTAGVERIENAVVAAAYDSPKLLEKLMESAQNEIRAITSSLANVAPAWAKMRKTAAAGEIDSRYDITDELADAAMRVAEARRRGTKPAGILSQVDAFDPMSPVTEEFIRGFYNADMGRAASAKAVTEFLAQYIKTAEAQKAADGLFGAEPGKAPVDILKELLRQRDNPNGGDLFDAPVDDKEKADELQGQRANEHSPTGRGFDAGPAGRADRRSGDGRLRGGGDAGGRRRQVSGAEGPPGRNSRDGHAGGQASRQGSLADAEGRVAASEAIPGRNGGGGLSGSAQGVASSEAEAAGARGPRRPGNADAGRARRGNAAAGAASQHRDLAAALDEFEAEQEAPYATVNPAARGAYKPSFEQASFTTRTSIFNSAAEELGLDPDKFRLLPGPRQVALLQRVMGQRFGIRVEVEGQLQDRFAIDQMLDAFQNAQGMAHVLGLPARAISLDGKLSLKLVKRANYLGVYNSGTNQISLPKRSNSFAHEWGHALDYHMLRLTDGDGRGLSGAVRKEGSDIESGELPSDVRGAFVHLLNAMFFDKAALAAKALELEAKIAATKGAKTKAQLEAQLQRIKDGSSQARGIRSAFYKGAQDFDGPGGDYWTSPTEMLARSFEAYVSYRVEAAGLTTEFIGKGDAQYLDGAGERFEKTFPKGEDRADIFAAYDVLFARIAEAQLAAEGEAAPRPTGSTSRVTDYDRAPAVVSERNLIKRELQAIRSGIRRAKEEKADRAREPKGLVEKAGDLNGSVFMSMTGNLRMVQKRSGSPALQQLIDLLTKQDGRGDRSVARTFAEDVHIQSRRGINRLANILKANAAEDLDAAERRTLRDLLIGATEDGPANLVKAAAAIRHLLDEEFYVNQRAGIDLGYVKNGYLQRSLDLPRVWEDERGFVAAATEVYEIVFDNAFLDPDTVLGDPERLARFLKLARSLQKQGYGMSFFGETVAALKALKKADESGDEAAIEAALEKAQEALESLWDQVRPAFADERANAWLSRINLVAGDEHNAAAPDSRYIKQRTLPPEADKIMEKFYLQDPVESVVNYLTQSARRTAYARRFGADGKKRKALFERMAKEGVSPDDQRTVERILDTATGRKRSELPKSVQDGLGVVNAAGIMVLLPRAMLSSLAEPFTAGLVTGNAMDGFKIVGKMVGSALGSPSGKVRYELARAMGVVSDLASDGIMEARYGYTWADQTRYDRFVSTMFRRTGLTPLTRAQKTAGVGLGHSFLDNLSQKVAGPEDKARDHAIALLRELGIRDPEAFAAQLLEMGRMPSVEELDSGFGHDYSTAQLRFSDMVIQNPNAMDRPELSQNPVGRVIYGITGFNYSYWRNIIKRNGILLAEMAKRDGPRAALYAGQLMAAAAVAYLMQTTVSTIREYYLNPKRWRDLQKEGELEKTMLQLGATRTFAFGGADPVIQSITGLKYQRDLSGLFVGPGPGFFLQAGEKIMKLGVNNSRKTNTAEYNATQGAYQLASPMLAFGLVRLPGGPIIDILTGISLAYLTSARARDEVATAVAGPKHGKPGPDGKKVKSGPTSYDRMLNRTLGEVKRKERESS